MAVYIIAAGDKEMMTLKLLITSSLTSNLMVRTLTLEILHYIFRLPSLPKLVDDKHFVCETAIFIHLILVIALIKTLFNDVFAS